MAEIKTFSTRGTVAPSSPSLDRAAEASSLRAKLDDMCRKDMEALADDLRATRLQAVTVAQWDRGPVGVREEARKLVGALTASVNTISALLERGQ